LSDDGAPMSLMRRVCRIAPAAVVAVALAAASSSAETFEGPEDLPEGEGREETFYNCVACHSFQVVVRQGMSRSMWQDTVTLMMEQHGMWALDEEEERLIVDYLAEHFPPSRGEAGTRRGGWTNPFAQ
jgi:2-methylcitrate dehydratase PrpD